MNDIYEEYNNYRRLHPLTLLYGLLRNLPVIAITLYFALQGDTEEIIYILIFIITGMFVIPGHILRWYYFSFLINEKEIIIKSGVFSRQTRNIPIERVQNVNVRQDVLQRIFGIAKIQIETAGDISSEGTLEYVKLKDADEINRIIRTYQKKLSSRDTLETESESSSEESKKSDSSETFNPSEGGDVLFEMSRKDVLVYGMVRLRPLFLVYGIWAMSYITQFQYLNDLVFGYLDETMESFVDLPIYYLVLLVVAFALFSILISWIIDIVWTFAQFYGFRLIKDGNKLFESYGLLSKISSTIPLKKLQQITISTNPVKKKFDFYSMSLQTAGFDVYQKKANSGVPLAKKLQLSEITSKIFPVEIPESFNSISEKAIRRAFIRYLILLTFPIVAGYFFVEWYTALGLLLAPLAYYFAYLRWKFRGYHIAKDLIFIKQGFWIQKVSIIPLIKIQTLHIKESFFQRKLGLATLFVDTASSFNINDAIIPDIDSSDAKHILDHLNREFNNAIVGV